MDVLIVLLDLIQYLIDDPQCSFQVQHLVVIVVLSLHQLDSILQQFYLSLLQSQLVLVLSNVLEQVEVVGGRACRLFRELRILQFLLEPLNLLPCHHLIVSLFSLLLQLGDLQLIALLDPADVGFFLGEPNLVEFEEGFLDAVFAHLLILELHLQHYLVACCWSPHQPLIELDFAAAARSLFLDRLVEGVAFEPLGDVAQVVDFLEVFCEVAELPVLFCVFEEENKSVDCLLGLVEFQQLSSFGVFGQTDLVHIVFQLCYFVLLHFVEAVYVLDLGFTVPESELQRLDLEVESIDLLVLAVELHV